MIKAKVIKPHTPFKPGVFREEIKIELATIEAGMLKDFEKTVASWDHEVEFKTTTTVTPSQVSATVKTSDPIYRYVDQGTKKHIIRPRKARMLRFQSKYKAKTEPHVISSHAGGPSGKEVFATVVHHPGTDARYFARDIQAKWQPKMKKQIEQAIARAARKSGHSSKS